MARVDVWLTTPVAGGCSTEQCLAAFVRETGIGRKRARIILSGEAPTLLKSPLPSEAGQALVRKLAALGIAAQLRPTGAPAAGPLFLSPVPEPEAENFNPYAAPKADLSRPPAPGEGWWRERARLVPAANGWLWITTAWQLIKARKIVWLGFFLLFLLFLAGMGALVFAARQLNHAFGFWPHSPGWYVFPALMSSITLAAGGIALAAHRQMARERGEAMDLAGNRRQRWGELLLLGLLVLCVSLPVFMAFLKLPSAIDHLLLLLVKLTLAMTSTLVMCGAFHAPRALVAGIMGLARNWRALLVCILDSLLMAIPASVPFALLTVIPGLQRLGTLLWMEGFSFFALLMGYCAARDLFYSNGSA